MSALVKKMDAPLGITLRQMLQEVRRMCKTRNQLPVMLVYSTVDNILSLQVHGVQAYHRLICDAVGIAQTWYQGETTGQNPLLRTIPP